jgi:hypothetical protein
VDKFYTPEPLARDLLSRCSFVTSSARVMDPSCGGGALLSAAEIVLSAKSCVGIDLDGGTIRSLRRTKPHWRLSVANLLCERSVRKSLAGKSELAPSVLLLNPPFSQNDRKYVEFQRPNGEIFRVGRAMQFLLQAIELFKPTEGIFAIVPESLIYSELDEQARNLIGSEFKVREIAALKSSTFKGARVRSIALELRRNLDREKTARNHTSGAIPIRFERGSLPVHRAVPCHNGAPFIHTTDLLSLAEKRFCGFNVEAGRICQRGWALLLPRVGVPKLSIIRKNYFARPVRLSDCVMALWCRDRHSVEFIERTVLDNWPEFIHLYRGTGARYVTVARIQCWLAEKGIIAESL